MNNIKLKIYTDGAYSFNKDIGGWAYIVLYNDEIYHMDFGAVKNTTNNRMELTAILNAIKYIDSLDIKIENTNVKTKFNSTIYSDSTYSIGVITKEMISTKNEDLIDKFKKYNLSNFNFKYVKGHSDNEFNNLCDRMAVLATKIDNGEYI